MALPSKIVDLLNTEPEITHAKPKRKAKATPKQDTPQQNIEQFDAAEPAKQTGLLQKTVDLLNTELEITEPKLKWKAKATLKKCI